MSNGVENGVFENEIEREKISDKIKESNQTKKFMTRNVRIYSGLLQKCSSFGWTYCNRTVKSFFMRERITRCSLGIVIMTQSFHNTLRYSLPSRLY